MRSTTDLGVRLGRLVTGKRVAVYAAIALTVVVAEYLYGYAAGNGFLDRYGQVKGTDFLQFYVAGQLVARGQASQLYIFSPPFQFPAQFAAEARVLAPQVTDPNAAFVVPPFYALLFVPLSYLPYLPAFLVWTALNCLLLAVTLRMLRPQVELLQGPHRGLVYLVAFSFFPFLECLFDGQNGIVSLFLISATYVALRRHWNVLAGMALGFALYKPQLVAVLALLLLLACNWRALASLMITGAGLVALSWTMVGSQGVADYLALSGTMLGWVFIPGWRTWNMHSWYSFFVLLVRDPLVSRTLTAVATVATLGALILACRRLRVQGTGRFDLQFSLAVIGTTLISPHVFAYDLSILILPGLLLANADSLGWLKGSPSLAGWSRVLLAAGYFVPLFSRFTAIALGFQFSVLVIAGIFATTAMIVSRAGWTTPPVESAPSRMA